MLINIIVKNKVLPPLKTTLKNNVKLAQKKKNTVLTELLPDHNAK